MSSIPPPGITDPPDPSCDPSKDKNKEPEQHPEHHDQPESGTEHEADKDK